MSRIAALAVIIASALPAALVAQAPPPELQGGLEIKWMRDSEEYAAIARQLYRNAERAVTDAARRQPRGSAWAVVLDMDETALDNSAHQLERLAYRVPFDSSEWNAWTRRVEAGAVPGVADFIAAVRRLGGHVAWISNRVESVREATRVNLAARGLWNDDDRLCLEPEPASRKTARRAEVASGSGRCSWNGTAMTVLAFVGDQMSDFPQTGEQDPDAGRDEAFGVRYFLLPNAMYGAWVTRVTRRDR